jgi:hypothetical protein
MIASKKGKTHSECENLVSSLGILEFHQTTLNPHIVPGMIKKKKKHS